MQSQVASLASNGLPMPFTQEAVPFAYGSSTNSREMLNNNLALSNSVINSSLPNLHIDGSVFERNIDGSVVPRQTLDGGNSGGGGVPPLQDDRIDHQAVNSHLNYNNELMGTSRLQRGLSGGLDDIVVNMFKPVSSYKSFLFSTVVSISVPSFYVNHVNFFFPIAGPCRQWRPLH
jgi:two-component response regulator (ARR-B family)